MKIIKNIMESMTIGSNCSTTASRIILKHYGYNFSEDMIFGLGAGLGFIYQYYADTDEYFLSGKNESIELNVAHALGGTLITGSCDDDELAWESVKRFIDDDIPVILDLSISHLPYFGPYMSEVANIGFGLHNAILVGYDDKTQEVMLLDHRWDTPQIISYENLKMARNKSEGNVCAHNAYKVYDLCTHSSKVIPDLSYSIRLNINRMNNPFAYKMGLPGIKTFHNEIKLLFEEGLQKQKADAIITYSYLMEKLGTGGGNFRRMYSRFLKEAYQLTQITEYKEVSRIYMRLANRWKELSFILNQVIDNPHMISEFDVIMKEIVESEAEAIERLEKIIGRSNYGQEDNICNTTSQISDAFC